MSSQLLINEPPLQVLPTLAKTIGLNEAIILQQVHYWLNPQFNKNLFEDRHWVHNTLVQWQRQFAFWSVPTIKRTICTLEESGLLLSYIPRDFKKTKYYAINYDLLNNTYLRNSKACVKASETQSIHCIKNPECFSSHPLDQNDPIDGIKMIISNGSNCTSRWGQNEPIDEIKMIPSLYRENTNPENTTENTPPPLSPPPQFLTQETQEEEEEEQNKKYDFETLNNPSEQSQSLPSTHSVYQTKEEELTDQDQQLFSEMIEIWNLTVQSKFNSGQEVRLTDKRKSLLRTCLNEVFSNIATDQKLVAWRNYCTLIAKSRFLSGQNTNGFKVTLDWALLPDNAYKVLEGAIYDRPQTVTKQQQGELSWEEFSAEIVRSAPSSKYLVQWVKMSVIIARFIGQPKYRHWFSRVILSDISDTTATFLVEGQITKDIIIRQYTSELRCAVQEFYPTVHQLEFKVVSNLRDNE